MVIGLVRKSKNNLGFLKIFLLLLAENHKVRHNTKNSHLKNVKNVYMLIMLI